MDAAYWPLCRPLSINSIIIVDTVLFSAFALSRSLLARSLRNMTRTASDLFSLSGLRSVFLVDFFIV